MTSLLRVLAGCATTASTARYAKNGSDAITTSFHALEAFPYVCKSLWFFIGNNNQAHSTRIEWAIFMSIKITGVHYEFSIIRK